MTAGAHDRGAEARSGYAPLRAYAPIGDGRCVALVADDGAIDRLAWPDLDSASVFAAVLDHAAGGSCRVAPTVPFAVTRQYLSGTNVLEDDVRHRDRDREGGGRDDLPGPAAGPRPELQRRVHGVTGSVPMAWRVQPRFWYGQDATRLGWRSGIPVATAGSVALAVRTFGAGTPQLEAGAVGGASRPRRAPNDVGTVRRPPGASGLPHAGRAGRAVCAHGRELAHLDGHPDLRRALASGGSAQRAGAEAAGVRPLGSRGPPPPPRCPSRSAVGATGTTGTAGSVTRPSP